MREHDYQVVQKILGGDRRLWDTLYSNAYRTVLRCAATTDFTHLLSISDYRDATDEAFTLCFQHLERYRGLSRFAYWVGGYARNLIRNHRRAELIRIRGQKRLSQIAALDMWGQDPLAILIRAEQNQCLRNAFFELTSMEQSILWKRSVCNLSARKMAQEMVLPGKEVRSQYLAALRHLKQRFLYHYYCPKPTFSKSRTLPLYYAIKKRRH